MVIEEENLTFARKITEESVKGKGTFAVSHLQVHPRDFYLPINQLMAIRVIDKAKLHVGPRSN